jgi:NADH dehydrogenase FAD-containing subunit
MTTVDESAPPPVNIVILGASYAGLLTAHTFLRQALPQLCTTRTAPAYRVVLIAPSTHLYWNVAAPRAIADPAVLHGKAGAGAKRKKERGGRRSGGRGLAVEGADGGSEPLFKPFLPAFADYPSTVFEFIQGEATGISLTQRTVTITPTVPDPPDATSSGRSSARISRVSRITTSSASSAAAAKLQEQRKPRTMTYHALVVATGASAHSELLSLHGPHERTARALAAWHRGLRGASSVIVVGAGPSAVECAGQLATVVGRVRRKRAGSKVRKSGDKAKEAEKEKGEGAKLDSINVTLISGNETLLPGQDEKVGAEAEKQLKSLGVNIMHGVRLITAQELPSRSTRCVLSNDLTIACDLLVAATGAEPNTRFLPDHILDASSYVAVDRLYMRVPRGGSRVYAVGSCCGGFDRMSLTDIVKSVSVLVHNLRNDLWEFEIRTQNPFGGGEDRLEALKDVWFRQDLNTTMLCPITRWGGVGVSRGFRLPGILVWLLKGRNYDLKRAKKVVVGEKAFN